MKELLTEFSEKLTWLTFILTCENEVLLMRMQKNAAKIGPNFIEISLISKKHADFYLPLKSRNINPFVK